MNLAPYPNPFAKTATAKTANYRLRLAQSASDVRAAQGLRFQVFNLELSEGLEESFNTCLDADRFDPVCDHLLIEDLASEEIIGTYRLQTGTQAKRNLGYYCEQEFDFQPYEPVRSQLLELGRACIHARHRNFSVLNLLWKGIAAYAREHGARYLIGCSSLTSVDPATGAAVFQVLQSRLVAPEFRTRPLPAFVCSLAHAALRTPPIPKLLTAYLALGGKICGPPALDRAFKTIDFLTLMDLHCVSPRWGGFGLSMP